MKTLEKVREEGRKSFPKLTFGQDNEKLELEKSLHLARITLDYLETELAKAHKALDKAKIRRNVAGSKMYDLTLAGRIRILAGVKK